MSTARLARVSTDDIAQELDIDIVFIEPLHVNKNGDAVVMPLWDCVLGIGRLVCVGLVAYFGGALHEIANIAH